MLSVTYKPFMLSVSVLNVVMSKAKAETSFKTVAKTVTKAGASFTKLHFTINL
jgi:hypothetical protein